MPSGTPRSSSSLTAITPSRLAAHNSSGATAHSPLRMSPRCATSSRERESSPRTLWTHSEDVDNPCSYELVDFLTLNVSVAATLEHPGPRERVTAAQHGAEDDPPS
ncbi:hypothetical protein GCM10023204_61040 [Actinomycetospora succinea]